MSVASAWAVRKQNVPNGLQFNYSDFLQGNGNEATGESSAISGGLLNEAAGTCAVVSGGKCLYFCPSGTQTEEARII